MKIRIKTISKLNVLVFPVLAVCLLMFSTSIQAEISLSKVFLPEKQKSSGEIISMLESESGVILALDGVSGKIIKFSLDNDSVELLTTEKILSSGRPGGMGLAGEDMLVVTNASNDEFVLASTEGEVLASMGESGSKAGKISAPRGIYFSNNRRIYIADKDNDRISVFGADGVYIKSIGLNRKTNESYVNQPIQVEVDKQERVFVLEEKNQGQLVIFDDAGNLIKIFSNKNLEKILGADVQITAMAIDDFGSVFLADSGNGRIYHINWEQEKKLNAFGSKGEERGQFQKISALLALNDSRLAVADRENKKIEIYNISVENRMISEQKRLPTVTRYLPVRMECNKAYRMNNGSALCLNRSDGKVSVVSKKSKLIQEITGVRNPRAASIDGENIVLLDGNRIKIFDQQGNKKYVGKGYGGEGEVDGKLDSPESVFIRHDKIYIADTGNKRIQIFTSDGIYLDKIENPKDESKQVFENPVSVVVDSQGNIFIADKGKRKLHVFSKNRKYLYSLGGENEKNKHFDDIYDLAIDADNNLYVLCGTESNRFSIKVYNGPKQVISFAAESESDAGMENPKNLTVGNTSRALIGVYDREKQRLLNFSYFQIPSSVGGVTVVGGTKQTEVSWSPVPGSFVKGYNIYASNSVDGAYEFVTQVYQNKAIIEHQGDSAKSFYKVNAFTGLGSQGGFSRVAEDVFNKAYGFYLKQDYAKAVEIFKPAIEENVEQAEVLKYLGLSLLELGKVDSAVQAFSEMSKIENYENEGLNLQIKALVAANDLISAKAVIEEVIERKIAVDDTYVFCGELSLKLGDAIGAITCLEEALIRDEKNIDAHFLMGDAYVKLNIIDKGLAEFEKAAAIEPENADVWYRAGLALRDLKKIDKAILKFEKAHELDDKHIQVKLELAKTWLLKKEFAKVKTIAISLAGKKETSAEGQYLIGLVAKAEGKNGEALLALMKSTRANQGNAEAWLALADVHKAMKQPAKVHLSLESAVKADPHSFVAAMRLGEVEIQEKEFKEAVVQFVNAVELRQDHYDARINLAEVLYRIGDYQQSFSQAVEASKINADEIRPIVLLSEIANKQGKTGKAIDYMKQAMQKKPGSLELVLGLGELYSENNLYDQAKLELEKAALIDASSYRPHVLLGGLFLKRRLFDQSIAAFDKAVSLKPSLENKRLLDKAYAEKKKSLEFKSNAPQIVLKDLRLQQIFSAAYKNYAKKPVGSVRVQNTSGTDYGNLKLSFSIKGYMDFPTSKEIPKLAANETQEVDLLASFNNRILEIDEDTGVQVEVALSFVRDGRDDAIKLTQPMTIYGKNAIVWSESNMVGSFVTPKDDTLRDFVRQAINENKPEPGPLSDNLVAAMTLFDVYGAHGIRYVVDPNNPYSEAINSSVDYVQFSRETLKIKSGDCDDLSVLMSAGLENLGINTAMLEVPGHLLMMFDSGVSVEDKNRISLQEDLMVEREGNIWIPVEATMIGTSFAEAWAEGARKYKLHKQENNLNAITLKNAWQKYLPVTLKPASYVVNVPKKEQVGPLVRREQNILMQKSLDRLVQPYEVMAMARPEDTNALMQIAIIYAKYGLYSQANKTFEKILKLNPDDSAVHNNRGNIFYSRKEYERAIETYRYAEQLAANDPGVKVNMAMAYYQLGKLSDARTKFDEAETINPSVNEKYAGLSQLLSR